MKEEIVKTLEYPQRPPISRDINRVYRDEIFTENLLVHSAVVTRECCNYSPSRRHTDIVIYF